MTSRVGPKGQVVIPKPLRDRLGIKPGDEVDFDFDGEAVLVTPYRESRSLRGAFAGAQLTTELERARRAK